MVKKICVFLALSSIILGSCSRTTKEASPRLMALEGTSSGQMIAYTARLEIKTKNPEETKTTLLENTKAYNGLITRESNLYLTVKIPVEKYNDYLQAIKGAGKLITSELRGEDISEYYENVILTLESKIAVRERYTLLLAQAISVTEVLAVERELERINIEIQQLEAQKQNSESRVNFITVTIILEKETRPGPLGWIFYGAYKALRWLFVWK